MVSPSPTSTRMASSAAGGGGAAGSYHRIEIAGVRPELGYIVAREPTGQAPDVRDRRGGSAGEHVDHFGGDAP